MKKIVHICFSQSAEGSLRYVIGKKKIIEGEKVIAFHDNISQGTIIDIMNIKQRLKWWDILNGEDEYNYYDIDALKENYNNFYDQLSNLNDDYTIYFWYGNCSKEICAMMYALELLKDKSMDMYYINVSNLVIKYKYGMYIPKHVGEVTPEKLDEYIKTKRRIDSKEYANILGQWNVLKKENSLLRIFREGKVISVKEDYFDIDVLKYTEREFRKSPRIIGSVLGFSEELIDDDYIFWRIKELIKSGRINYQGRFGFIREMEIKISEEGLKYLSNNFEAMKIWNSIDKKIRAEEEKRIEYKNQGRMEEKIEIAKKLLDVLDVETISEKTGLTIGQVESLHVTIDNCL